MRLAKTGYCLSLLAIAGIVLQAPLQAAEPVERAAPLAVDVMLDAEGSLTGTVVGPQGQPVASAAVSLSAAGIVRIDTVTDNEGHFHIAGLRGGIYQIAAGERAVAYRIWTPAAALPGAERSAVLVIESVTARGQTPLPDFVRSDAFLITAVVIAAIAIPIAIHNFRNDHPSGSRFLSSPGAGARTIVARRIGEPNDSAGAAVVARDSGLRRWQQRECSGGVSNLLSSPGDGPHQPIRGDKSAPAYLPMRKELMLTNSWPVWY